MSKASIKQLLKKVPLIYRLAVRLQHKMQACKYNAWFLQNAVLDAASLQEQSLMDFAYKPLISILVPTFNPPLEFLREMLDSVCRQSFPNWELCIADGGSKQEIQWLLQEYAARDKRIKLMLLPENRHICGNSNMALTLAEGDYVGLLDHDDILAANCLYEIVKVLNATSDVDLIYTDEDFYANGKHLMAHFKPDFAADSLRENNYITHFVLFKRQLISLIAAPTFREEFQGAQDYDLLLRLSEVACNIIHIPQILYHWRMHSGSSLGNPAVKNYAYQNGAHALNEHLKRIGRAGEVTFRKNLLGIYKVNYAVLNQPLISILIPNKDNLADLKPCIDSILNLSSYLNYEILIIENNSVETATFEYYQQLKETVNKVRLIYYPESGFNFSRINNYAVSFAKGEFLLFLNNDTQVISPRWLEEMLMYAQFKETGAVGAKLYFPDNTIQHAGIVISNDSLAGNLFDGIPKDYITNFARTHRVQNLSAVSAACLLLNKAKFIQVGMFDELLAVAFNDVDLCLKLRQAGYVNVFNPDAELFHYESKSRGYEDSPQKRARFLTEHDYFKNKWGAAFRDPYYNQALTTYNYGWS